MLKKEKKGMHSNQPNEEKSLDQEQKNNKNQLLLLKNILNINTNIESKIDQEQEQDQLQLQQQNEIREGNSQEGMQEILKKQGEQQVDDQQQDILVSQIQYEKWKQNKQKQLKEKYDKIYSKNLLDPFNVKSRNFNSPNSNINNLSPQQGSIGYLEKSSGQKKEEGQVCSKIRHLKSLSKQDYSFQPQINQVSQQLQREGQIHDRLFIMKKHLQEKQSKIMQDKKLEEERQMKHQFKPQTNNFNIKNIKRPKSQKQVFEYLYESGMETKAKLNEYQENFAKTNFSFVPTINNKSFQAQSDKDESFQFSKGFHSVLNRSCGENFFKSEFQTASKSSTSQD